MVCWLMMSVCGAQAAGEHPRLLVRAAHYEALRQRAEKEPWRSMREAVQSCTSLTYRPDGSAYRQYASMRHVMRQAALACILFPQERSRYVTHIVEQLGHWDDLNATRERQPRSDWSSMVTGGDAFFMSVLALDVIHDDLTDSQRTAIEQRLQTWFDYERDESTGSWVLAKYGAMGLWALYLDDREAFEAYAGAYDRRLRQHFTEDGVALVGGNYASARLAGGELAKTYFMDVLALHGWHDYYNDPLLGAFYEWFYAGMVTPTRRFAIFQDCGETTHSGTSGVIANWRAHRFSRTAAAHAAWFEPEDLTPGILGYVLVDEPLPEPRAPASRLWKSGYAALWEAPHADALMAALWAPNRAFQHDHFEINAVHLTGYSQTLLRNAGYEGWGNPVAGFSWKYVSRFDMWPESDHAVGGNIAYLHRDKPHRSKAGGGLQEGILHPSIDYAAGDAGDAVNGGQHARSIVLVKDRTRGERPYFLLFDEMTRHASTDSSLLEAPLRLALHPASNQQQTITPRRSYRWAYDQDVFLTIYLASEATEETRLKRGGLSQFEEAPLYLHAEFAFEAEQTQALTVLFPHHGETSAPAMTRIGGDGFSGAKIFHNEKTADLALASNGMRQVAHGDVEWTGRAAILRRRDQRTVLYLVRRSQQLVAPGAIGFDSDEPISLVMEGRTGQILSPGTDVNFHSDLVTGEIHLDGKRLSATPAAGGWRVHIPAGSHRIDFVE